MTSKFGKNKKVAHEQSRSQGPFSTSRVRERTLGTRFAHEAQTSVSLMFLGNLFSIQNEAKLIGSYA